MKVFRVGYALDKLTQPNPNLGSSDHVLPAVSGTHLRSLEAPLIEKKLDLGHEKLYIRKRA